MNNSKGIRRNKMNTNTALSWVVPVLILLFLPKQTKFVFDIGYNMGQPFTVKISRKMWEINPITRAAAILRLKIPINEKGINQINECPYPLCFPNSLSIMSGQTDIHPAKKIPINTLFRLVK
jgi:hypothetical protein